ncbi:ATP-grasp fold amidoligase family protein [Lutibacter holmesii]|uniref:ATP-grasp fold amidoligase family protein n=1 Tax=Lutibacter holmesii TaxID=1137985 RepID=A0ABW3WPK2_9FLAO
MTFLPSKIYVPFLYEYFTGKKLNFENPVEFNAKIQWYKVFYRPKILNQLVDKYEVRAYVEQKIGAKYLNEIYGVYTKPEEVDFDKLPNKFVIKAVHSSSHNLICEDKSALNLISCRKRFKKWLGTNQYYRTGQEWAYKDVKPKIIAEKFIEQEGRSSLIDYKFYCFNGVAKFVEVHLDRSQNHKRGFYDLTFNKLPFRYVSVDKSISEEIEKPNNFEEMIPLAEKLAANFPFVRVDFYSIKNQIIFGEMTFYPSDGRKDFYPESYNKIIGNYFILPKIPKGQKIITIE